MMQVRKGHLSEKIRSGGHLGTAAIRSTVLSGQARSCLAARRRRGA